MWSEKEQAVVAAEEYLVAEEHQASQRYSQKMWEGLFLVLSLGVIICVVWWLGRARAILLLAGPMLGLGALVQFWLAWRARRLVQKIETGRLLNQVRVRRLWDPLH